MQFAPRKFGFWLVVWLGLLFVGFGTVWLIGLPAPELRLPSDGQLSERGKILLEFPRSISLEQVQQRVTITPSIEGTWTVEGNRAAYSPKLALIPGQRYQIQVSSGSSFNIFSLRQRGASWDIEIRQPRILYLGATSSQPELWSSAADGSNAQVLTRTGGKVTGFGVSTDGEWIAYSVMNAQEGQDLWLIRRNGQDAHRLVDCGTDECSSPAWSPAGDSILFVRRDAQMSSDALSARLWWVHPEQGDASPFLEDPNLPGLDPSWSPDGNSIAYYDPSAKGVRVVQINGTESDFFPTQSETTGDWSPDGKQMLITDLDQAAFSSAVIIYLADLETHDFQLLFSDTYDQMDYGLPIWSPDGKSVTIARRPASDQMGKQLTILGLDGSVIQMMTQDVMYNQAAYTWEPAGRGLLFQRFQLGSSDSLPEVAVWWQEANQIQVIATDASQPAWLP